MVLNNRRTGTVRRAMETLNLFSKKISLRKYMLNNTEYCLNIISLTEKCT